MSVNNEYQAKQIKVLEGLEPVRKRPGMYIGSTDTKGLHHLAAEIVDNAVDEAIAGFGSQITMYRNLARQEEYAKLTGKDLELFGDQEIVVVDAGRGIPVDKHESGVSALEVVLTKLHAGGKFEETAYQASGGLHGVGSSAVNALSAIMQVVVKRDNKYYYLILSQGEVIEHVKVIPEAEFKKLFPKEAPALIANQTGTLVAFVPDTSIFQTDKFSHTTLMRALEDRAYLMAGIYFIFVDTIKDLEQHFFFENGIRSLVQHLNRDKKPVSDVFYTSSFWTDPNTNKKVGAEIAVQYNDTYSEKLESYVNVIPTPDGGTHVNGFRLALNKCLKDYADKNKLLKEKESFTTEDLREGLTAVIFVKMPANDLQFEGQTKSRLNNSEAQSAVYQIMKDAFSTFLEENPKVGKSIIDKIMLAARARLAARAAKDAVIRKGALEGNSLPGKLADCQSKLAEECEIYIVEGDSAGGSAKQGRDRKFQAIFPLRGKILNTERARLNKVIESEELKNLIIALGAGVGDTFNAEKLRYHRVILMADADVDGGHIAALCLTFFYRHLPEILEGGHLYIAMPPLYRVAGGGNESYVYSDEEKDEMVDKIKTTKPNADISIQRYKGLGEMNPEQLWETTMNPQNRILKKITLDEASKVDKTFSVLMGDDVPPRKKFIQSHAQLAELDI